MPSVGVGCMPRFAAVPSTDMEATFGRLHKNGVGVFGAGSIVRECILVNGRATNIDMQTAPTEGATHTAGPMPKNAVCRGWGTFPFPDNYSRLLNFVRSP